MTAAASKTGRQNSVSTTTNSGDDACHIFLTVGRHDPQRAVRKRSLAAP
jgi:hypothetical protein